MLTLSPRWLAGCLASLLAVLPVRAQPALKVSADFPGGSARVETIDQEKRSIRVGPQPHLDRGWACWWYFKVEGIVPGETLTLDVGSGSYATPERAHFSLDHKQWQHTEPGRRQEQRIVYRQRVDAREAWFAWGPPFVTGEDGETVEWSVELDPPVLLRRYGWRGSTVEAGDAIKFTGAPALSGAPLMRGAIAELEDGTELRVWSRV